MCRNQSYRYPMSQNRDLGHLTTGIEGTVEIEFEWTAARRGRKLPAGFETKMLEG